ncbi:MAG: NAD(P)/FAD-dependent oxidoreductase [Deltaproteobacteria bacterium]|nr:NAD(P)/FAD-dependent oxidoreductase [Deltaproteobacteria bacterium]
MPTVDLAIIGAGPSGCTAAILAARQGLGVLLVERGPVDREKICGDLVAPEALPVLRELDPSLLAMGYRVGLARLHAGRRQFSLSLEPPALGLSRRALDVALWSAAERAGARCLERVEVRSVEGDGPFVVKSSADPYRAYAVIDATGRWSRLHPRKVHSDWVGLQANVREEPSCPLVDLYFFRGGYCGAQPVTEGILDVAAAVQRSRALRIEEVFALHPALAERSSRWSLVGPPRATAPLVFGPSSPVGQGTLRIGDAAGFIDPFFGHGIATALLTGKLVIEVLDDFFKGGATLETTLQTWRRRHREATGRAFTLAAGVRTLLRMPDPAFGALAAALAGMGSGSRLLAQARAFSAPAVGP